MTKPMENKEAASPFPPRVWIKRHVINGVNVFHAYETEQEAHSPVPYVPEAQLTETLKERDNWKWEYENVSKFASDFQDKLAEARNLLGVAEGALEAIARKAPSKVSREEAADMACEFHIISTEALAQLKRFSEEGN